MMESPERPSSEETYRQQYGEISSGGAARSSKIIIPLRFLVPVVILLAIVLALYEHSTLVTISNAVLAVIVLIAAIVLTRRERRVNAGQPAGGQRRDPATGADDR